MDKSEIVEDLKARYDKYVQDVKGEKKAIQERLAEQERVEVAASRERLTREFARRFALAKLRGMKRYELDLPVLRTKDGYKYKEMMSLGLEELGAELAGNVERVEAATRIAQDAGLTISRREVAVNLGLDPDDYTM